MKTLTISFGAAVISLLVGARSFGQSVEIHRDTANAVWNTLDKFKNYGYAAVWNLDGYNWGYFNSNAYFLARCAETSVVGWNYTHDNPRSSRMEMGAQWGLNSSYSPWEDRGASIYTTYDYVGGSYPNYVYSYRLKAAAGVGSKWTTWTVSVPQGKTVATTFDGIANIVTRESTSMGTEYSVKPLGKVRTSIWLGEVSVGIKDLGYFTRNDSWFGDHGYFADMKFYGAVVVKHQRYEKGVWMRVEHGATLGEYWSWGGSKSTKYNAPRVSSEKEILRY